MMSSWRTVTEFYNDLMENKSDPRTRDWSTMSGPLPTFIICISYVYFVKVIGPKLMKNRKPFDLRRVMIYYNLFQVILSTWIFCGALKYGWWNDFSFRCQPVDYSDTPRAMAGIGFSWFYHMSKFTELFDTFFFVLRKKNSHISNLHVYHHAMMPILTWFGMKFVPGGHSTFFGLVNTFVHIFMYGYYFLAGLGPHMKPYLWWKKYLTTLQLVQFTLVLVHEFQLFFIECDYPKIWVWTIFSQALVFLYLFKDFYIRTYIKKQK